MRFDPQIERAIFDAPSLVRGVEVKKTSFIERLGIANFMADVAILFVGVLLVIAFTNRPETAPAPPPEINDAEFVRRYMSTSNDLIRFERLLDDTRRTSEGLPREGDQ